VVLRHRPEGLPPRLYLKAAEALIAEGKIEREEVPFGTDGFKPATADFIDGIAYDGRQPNAYLEKLVIGLKGSQTVQGGQVVGADPSLRPSRPRPQQGSTPDGPRGEHHTASFDAPESLNRKFA
jgi:hypothetical protein